MKNKKILFYILAVVLISGLLSSCAIDRKCPAYTQAQTEITEFTA